MTLVDLPPLVELLFAARRVYGLAAPEAMDDVPYSWLLRARTFVWYYEGLGASPKFTKAGGKPARKRSKVEDLL